MKDLGAIYQKNIESFAKGAKPRIPFYSTVTGSELSDLDAFGSSYWRANLESPVLFNAAIRAAQKVQKSSTLYIELGPHPALQGPLSQILREVGQSGDSSVGSLVRDVDCQTSLLNLAGNLFLKGIPIRFPQVVPSGKILNNLPSYSWQRTGPYWDESRIVNEYRFRKHPPHELLGSRVIDGNDEPRWRNMLSTDNVSWVADHNVASKIIVPGAGFITMIGEALYQLTGIRPYTLRHVSISAALILNLGVPVEVSTRLSPMRLTESLDSSWFEFQISSYDGSSWMKHCSGEASSSVDSSIDPITTQPIVPLQRKVSTEGWYNTMKRVGLNYGPAFRGMSSISAAVDTKMGVATISNYEVSGGSTYAMHPATLDVCFQLMTVAAYQGQRRRYKRLDVPTYVEEIFINAASQEMYALATSPKDTQAITGSLIATDGQNVSLQMKGFKTSSLDNNFAAGSENTRNITQIEWKADSDFCHLGNFMKPCKRTRSEFILLEELFLLCIMEHEDQIVLCQDTPAHLHKFFSWIKNLAGSVRSGTCQTIPDSRSLARLGSSERVERIRAISSDVENTEFSSCALAIRRLFENATSIFDGTTNPLNVLMQDNVLIELYSAVELSDFGGLFEHLAHKNPQLRILEIGAGTGGTTAFVLRALHSVFKERMYAKYTYTDVSAGFMREAKERFGFYENIEYAVLDISQDPITQGFESGAYDLIIASNVSINTSVK